MILSRRSLIGSIITLACAPAIARASSLMPVKPFVIDGGQSLTYGELDALVREVFSIDASPNLYFANSHAVVKFREMVLQTNPLHAEFN